MRVFNDSNQSITNLLIIFIPDSFTQGQHIVVNPSSSPTIAEIYTLIESILIFSAKTLYFSVNVEINASTLSIFLSHHS